MTRSSFFPAFACVLLAGSILLPPAVADPPVTPPPGICFPPDLYCMRVTDIQEVPGDPEGDRFLFSFEFLNWTATEAHCLVFSLNTGTSNQQQAAPFFAGAIIDNDGRPLGPGSDDANYPPADGTAGLKIGRANTWVVTSQTATMITYTEPTGLPGPGIPARDLFGAGTTAGVCALIPGCTVMGGCGVIPNVETVDNGAPAVDGLPDNTLDGFVIDVDDFDPCETFSFNWFLTDAAGNPIGVSGMGNQFGFGTYNLFRPGPCPGGPPIWQRSAAAPEGSGANVGTSSNLRDMFVSTTSMGTQFEVEPGAALTGNFRNPNDNSMGAPVSAVPASSGTVLTQSLDVGTITQFNSVSCNAGGLHTDNAYGRSYDLNNQGVFANFNVTGVDFGVESAVAGNGVSQPFSINVYSDPAGGPGVISPYANLIQVGSSIPFQIPDLALVIHSQNLCNPIPFTVNGVDRCVIEIFTPDGQAAGNSFFIGSNPNGETNDTFLAAAACGLPDYATTTSIGFPTMHLVELVRIDGTTGTDPQCAGPTYPGTGEDFVLFSGINGPVNNVDRKTGLIAGDLLTVQTLSPAGTFDGQLLTVLGDIFVNGSPPAPPFPGIVVSGNPSTTVVIFGGSPTPPFGNPPLLPTGGLTFSVSYPAFLVGAGLSVMVQSLSSAGALAANGIFASTDGHEFTDGP